MRYLFLLIPAMAGLGLSGAGCSNQPVGCRSDQDCKGGLVCDVGNQVCVGRPAPDLASGPDLGTAPDLTPPGPDMAVPTTGKPLWAKRLGGQLHDQAFATAVDQSGNIIVAGSFQGTVDLGGGPLASKGDSDVFLAKFSPTGDHLWSKSFGGAGDDEAYGVAVDGSNAIVMVGAFQQSASFGGAALQSAGDYDGYVARYGADGSHLWSKPVGGTAADSVNSVAVAANGDLVFTGYFNNSIDLGKGALKSAGGADIFLARWGATGTAQWALRAGGAMDDFGNRVAMDAKGYAVVVGSFAGAVDFGGGPVRSAGGSDAFFARYSSTGILQWARGAGGVTDDLATAVAVDGSGNVVVAGDFQGTADFGTGQLTATGQIDVFLARYSPSGTPQWAHRYGGDAPARAGNLAADAGGTLLLVGDFNDMVDLGGGALGGGGMFVAKYGVDGAHLWSERFGGLENSDASAVALDADGNVIMAGGFQGSVDFGAAVLQSAGDSDGFLLKLQP